MKHRSAIAASAITSSAKAREPSAFRMPTPAQPPDREDPCAGRAGVRCDGESVGGKLIRTIGRARARFAIMLMANLKRLAYLRGAGVEAF